MASMWRDIAEQSYIENQRGGSSNGERLFVEVPDGQTNGSESAILPKMGDPYDATNPLCILTSFRKMQYMGSQRTGYLCRYTSEEIMAGVTGQAVPRDKFTAGAEMYSLSKDFIAKWTTAPNDPVNQVTQMIIPNGQYELYMVNDVKADAYDVATQWVGGISASKPWWLCVSSDVTELYGLKGAEMIDSTPTLYYRIRFVFAYRKDPDNVGWNALYRETATPPSWQLTDAPIYQEIDDFGTLLPL